MRPENSKAYHNVDIKLETMQPQFSLTRPMMQWRANRKKWHTTQTSFLRFICQCWSCSRGLFQRLLSPVTAKPPSTSIDSLTFSPRTGAFSLKPNNVLQSRGLHSPKSESFMWPFLSKRRLSGLISLSIKTHWNYYKNVQIKVSREHTKDYFQNISSVPSILKK